MFGSSAIGFTDERLLELQRDAFDSEFINNAVVDDEDYVVGYCENCKHEITKDMDHYDIDGEIVCGDRWGDCLYDHVFEKYGKEIGDSWYAQFDLGGEHFFILDEGSVTAQKLMEIFDPYFVEGEGDGF